jgi:hypothetical protein
VVVLVALGPNHLLPPPKILACGPGADVDGACGSGTALSTLVCSRIYCSVLAVSVGGGVALPDSSSGLWVDA